MGRSKHRLPKLRATAIWQRRCPALQSSRVCGGARRGKGKGVGSTFDQRGYLESGVVWIQVKSSDRPRKKRDSSAVLVRLQRRDILAWIADAYPVILVVYDAQSDCAYWLAIQGYFAGPEAFAKLKGKTITVPIPTASPLNERAMWGFARQKAVVLARRREP